MTNMKTLHWWEWLFLALALLFFAAQSGFSSLQKSATFDEEYHITSGYVYLKTGDTRLRLGHPLLMNVLSALPLLADKEIVLPLDNPSWAEGNYFTFSDVFMWQANHEPQKMVLWARWPIILTAVVLLAGLFFWARAFLGVWPGWLVLVLAVFDPNLLTHSHWVTTDLGITCFICLTIWRWWAWLERPSTANLLWAGLMAGCAMTTKFTGVLVWPMMGLILLIWPGYTHRRWLGLFGVGLVAYGVIWAVYGFHFGTIPQSNFPIPIPAPFYPYSVWDAFMVIEKEPVATYLWGAISERGWWYYFPVALAVKTPLPLLGLTAVGLWHVIRKGTWRRTAVLWVPPLLFLGLAMTGQMTIGYRHILPVVPFLILLAGTAIQDLPLRRLWPVGLLLLWQAGSVLWLFPHYEAYFNEVAGGPVGGSRILSDSNIDWGQDLIALRALMDEYQIDEVNLAYFGTALPEAYGIVYRPLPSFLRFLAGSEVNAFNPYTPEPGWYAISITSLRQGMVYQNNDIYAYFRDKEPVARAGYSINLYHVTYPAEMRIERRTVVGQMVGDIAAADLRYVAGRQLVVKWVADPETTVTSGETFLEPPLAHFEDYFDLLAVTPSLDAYQAGQTVDLTVTWRVGEKPLPELNPATARPLAAFVHLSADDPSHIIAQYDGWPTALRGLEVGDVIRQVVHLSIPSDTPPGNYHVRVGLYLPATGARLPILDQGATSDIAPLDVVDVLSLTVVAP